MPRGSLGAVTESGTDILRRRAGLIGGPLVCAAVLLAAGSMPAPAGRTAAVGALMAIWWITEAIPLAATALLPVVLFPLLGIASIGQATSPYANPVIFLFLGGFIIAKALAVCGLHRRFALATIARVGTRPASVVLGFMVATAFISLWVSNTATVAMMYPMALSVILLRDRDGAAPDPGFAPALLLGVAYASSIGGIGTLIGTPPNALLAGYLAEAHGRQIGFFQWMMIGVPIVAIGIPVTWLLLVKRLHPLPGGEAPGSREVFRLELAALGSATRAEWIVGSVTLLAAVAWMIRPVLERAVPGMSDSAIAIGAALLMFLIPVKRGTLQPALRWEQAQDIPWSVLLLFGGGLTLAEAMSSSGLAGWIGNSFLGLRTLPLVALILVVTVSVGLLSELASNTASAAVFLPIVGSIAVAMGTDPVVPAVATALAASCGFMLPVATPPNAIVFGSGKLTVGQMARAGILVDLLMLILINVAILLLGPRIFPAP